MGTKEQVRVIRFFRTSQRIAIEMVWKSKPTWEFSSIIEIPVPNIRYFTFLSQWFIPFESIMDQNVQQLSEILFLGRHSFSISADWWIQLLLSWTIFSTCFRLINFADQFNCDPLTCSAESDDSYVFFRAHIATDFTCGDQAYSWIQADCQTRLRNIYLFESSGLIWFSPFESKHNTNCPKFYFLDDTPPTQILLTDGSDCGIGCYMGTKEQVRVIWFFRKSQRIAIELMN
jgi:hypothetical protein